MLPRRCSPLFFLLLLCALPSVALAQNGFHAVHSRDGIDAWAVGDGGVFYRSLDRGLSWSSGTLGTSRLRDVTARGLTVLAVADDGKVWRSTDSGGTWSFQPVGGSLSLHSIAMPNPSTVFVVGAGGLILKSEDGGANWTPQTSGTSVRLNAVTFADELFGWAVGENGTALSTNDGGATWNLAPTGTTRELFSVMQRGSVVWLVGARGTALKSVDGGASFSPVDLQLEASSDVRCVWLQSADSVYIAGGGGFIRRSVNGGGTWTFPVHNMHGQISGLEFAGGTGFIVSNRHRLPMSTIDRGTTWRFPTGATLTRVWLQKLSFAGQVRGSSIALNAKNPGTLYAALGSTIYRSQDDGETWVSFKTIPGSKVNAFIVSPEDTSLFVAAVSGSVPKQIVKSTDQGSTWTQTLLHDFGEYGIPLEYDHDQPSTMYFGGDADGLYRSTDAGTSWARISDVTFRSPCDIVVVPGQPNTIVLGDGVTGAGQGEFWKSTDGGATFALKATRPAGASEIPGMSISRLRNNAIFGTNWGSGGVQRSTDYGENWPSVSNISSAWGTDIAKDDPNLVMFGVYSGGNSWISVDGGGTFINHGIGGANYSFYLRDRETILAEQSSGVYKMAFIYNYTPANTQSAFVIVPNGGETWLAGTVHDIQWSSVNVPLVSVEFRAAATDPWLQVAQVPGYNGHYQWPVPNAPTGTARVRVRDASDASPEDISNGDFTILAAAAGVDDPSTSFGLWQNRPNPFVGATSIGYALPYETDVDLEVYDLQGQRVATLVRGRQSPGGHSVTFGRGATTASGARLGAVPSGVYFYRLTAGTFSQTRKMLLLK